MFLTNAAAKLAPTVEKQADNWLDKGVDQLRSVVVPALPPSTQPMAAVLTDMIASSAGRDALKGLTHQGFTTITGYLALDAMDEARFAYLRDVATFDEGQDALLSAIAGSVVAKRQSDAEWERTKEFLLQLLAAAGKAAIPLLLAMV